MSDTLIRDLGIPLATFVICFLSTIIVVIHAELFLIALAVMALDTQAKGRPDRRLLYKPDGSFDHVETDPTGSGTFKATTP